MSYTSSVIIQDFNQTGGHLRIESKGGDVAPDTVTTFNEVWPFPICGLTIRFNTTHLNTGDLLDLIIGPNTTIGTLTAAASVSDTVLTVSQTVIDNIKVGYILTVTDGTNTDTDTMVTSIDDVNLTVTIETPLANAYAIGAFVQMSVYLVKNYEFGVPGIQVFGEDKISGSIVPANTTVRILYNNRESTKKRFIAQLEYLY